MSTFTAEQFISHFETLHPTFHAVDNAKNGDEGISVYPPAGYVFDYAVDVFFVGDRVLLTCDGDKVKEFDPKATLEKVAAKVVEELDALQFELT